MLDDSPVVSTLPPYTVRVSPRARHVRLTVSARDGLVVVVPRGWRGDPARLVAAKRSWAERALGRVAEQRAAHVAGPEALLPAAVDLLACERRLAVSYVEGDRPPVARERAGELVVTGAADAAARLAALRRWLDREARRVIPLRVQSLAGVHGLSPSRVRVMRARTRWGSCSARGVIAIARNALFLPSEALDALVLHELAHLRVLDHSPRFWVQLLSLDPRAHEHRALLRRGSEFVPPWADE